MNDNQQAQIETKPVQSYEDCPRCKSTRSLILETHVTGEQSGICLECGFQYARTVVVNHKKEPLLNFEGKFTYKEEKIEAYGIIDLLDKEGNGQTYSVPTEQDLLTNIIPYISSNLEDIDHAILSLFDGSAIIKRDLLIELNLSNNENSIL